MPVSLLKDINDLKHIIYPIKKNRWLQTRYTTFAYSNSLLRKAVH